VRIQNKRLWERYCNQKTDLTRENEGDISELDLFHGTFLTDPIKIYQGKIGFDIQFSNKGMWGYGIYFAVNAHMSYDQYGYTTPEKKKQIILAKVLAGKVDKCAPNSELFRPGLLPNYKGEHVDARFDSCSGYHSGGKSDIYILYDNDRAYPSYLITF